MLDGVAKVVHAVDSIRGVGGHGHVMLDDPLKRQVPRCEVRHVMGTRRTLRVFVARHVLDPVPMDRHTQGVTVDSVRSSTWLKYRSVMASDTRSASRRHARGR